jgi:hypothetical protein
MINYIFAGLLAGLALAAVFTVYLSFRGRTLAAFFKRTDEEIARMPENVLLLIVWAAFIGASLLWGAVAGFVYSFVGSQTAFLALGLGAAVALSLVAVVTRTPLTGEKVLWNLAVGGMLGVLVPLFAGM